MAIIGYFTKQDDGKFTGSLQTLSTSARLTFEPQTKRGVKSPDFRITCGLAEYGAAWKRSSENGEHLSVRIDNPSFPAPLNCRLTKTGAEHGYSLIWERDRKRS